MKSVNEAPGQPGTLLFPNQQISKIVQAIATAGFKQAPVLEPATQIIANSVKATAKQDKNPSLVGDVLPVFTSKLIMTKMNVTISSIQKALTILTFG